MATSLETSNPKERPITDYTRLLALRGGPQFSWVTQATEPRPVIWTKVRLVQKGSLLLYSVHCTRFKNCNKLGCEECPFPSNFKVVFVMHKQPLLSFLRRRSKYVTKCFSSILFVFLENKEKNTANRSDILVSLFLFCHRIYL